MISRKTFLPLTVLVLTSLLAIAADTNSAAKFEQTKAKAEQGDEKSQVLLGLMYSEGEGVEKNLSEAVKWYRAAAEKGNRKGRPCWDLPTSMEMA